MPRLPLSFLTVRQGCSPLSAMAVLLLLLGVSAARGEDPPAVPGSESTASDKARPVALNPNGTVLLDRANNKVLLKAHIAVREGSLEFLCCINQTKEHESLLAVDTKAYVIHAALLALKAEAGGPAKSQPEFKPPTGQPIDIYLNWDADGKTQRVKAQQVVRYVTRRFFSKVLETYPAGLKIPEKSELRWDNKHKELSWFGPMTAAQKQELLSLSQDKAYRDAIEDFQQRGTSRPMQATFVFVGSGFYNDETSGKKFYLAEDGDLISVANFSSAIIDVAIRSSDSNDTLLFESWTEKLPPKGTSVTVELIPVFDKPKQESSAPATQAKPK